MWLVRDIKLKGHDRLVQSRQWVDGSMGQMGHIFGWVAWVMGRGMVTHDPLLDYIRQGNSQTNTVNIAVLL